MHLPMPCRQVAITQRERSRGFTLVELMVTMVIVAIMLGVAIPTYSNYSRRGYIQEATSALAAGRVAVEQRFLDNRSYADVDTTACPASTSRFALTCPVHTATTYTITATGSGAVAGFVYTINESGVRTTAGPWGSGNCWIMRKGDTC